MSLPALPPPSDIRHQFHLLFAGNLKNDGRKENFYGSLYWEPSRLQYIYAENPITEYAMN